MKTLLSLRHLAIVGLAAATLAALPMVQAADQSLTIGSDAPALDVEHWFSDGNGKYEHVSKFEDGKVYVVEFWATWCPPCIASMPHLAETQEKYREQGVQFVSVSDEDIETVETFLEKEVRGSKADNPKTYGELTSVYCLTTDTDGSVSEDYMQAAGQNGIPTAFLVGKTGKIEWIGHPMQMDEPLEKVVSNSWDRDAFAKKYESTRLMEIAMAKIGRLMATGKAPEAVAELDKLIAAVEDPEVVEQISSMKLQALVEAKMGAEFSKLASKYLKDDATNPMFVNAVAWSVYQLSAEGDLESPEMVGLAAVATEKAIGKLDKADRPSALDTLAHLYEVQGEKQKAYDTQAKAIEISEDPDEKESLQGYLDELKEALGK
jgi:thiol-disulfide isomerase/thioredoxin